MAVGHEIDQGGKRLERDHVYIGPPDSSIDVLFDSAAATYGERAVGIVLTGANEDGAAGLAKIKDCGGGAIVQDPSTSADAVLPLGEIPASLYGLCAEVGS